MSLFSHILMSYFSPSFNFLIFTVFLRRVNISLLTTRGYAKPASEASVILDNVLGYTKFCELCEENLGEAPGEAANRLWWTVPDLNRRPSRCHRDALPTAPTAPSTFTMPLRGIEPLSRA